MIKIFVPQVKRRGIEANMFVKNFDHLLELAKKKKSNKVAVVAADDLEVLEVIRQAEEINLAKFILIGDVAKMRSLILENGFDMKAALLEECDHKKAADLAVDLIIDGKAGTLMKGMIHSSTFLKAILNKEKGLNTGKHITQISVMEKEDKDGFTMLTDCAITVSPDLLEKKEILENAVDLSHKLGLKTPLVAVLASLEVVNPNMQDTIDAAVLSKMAERGQIKRCIVDGPFALDNAISIEAARLKGITGPVAGNADIIVVPNLTVGNAVSKAISYIAKKTMIAATVGTEVPIVFTSRTESIKGKLLSIALATYIS